MQTDILRTLEKTQTCAFVTAAEDFLFHINTHMHVEIDSANMHTTIVRLLLFLAFCLLVFLSARVCQSFYILKNDHVLCT